MANPLGLTHPSILLVIGASQSGKTRWCLRLAKNAEHVYNHRFKNIVFCYQAEEALPREELKAIPNVILYPGIPSDFSELPAESLIIVDDCPKTSANSEAFLNLATKGCHHSRQSVVICLHNLFTDGKNLRTLALNSHYYLIYRSLRDKAQIDVFLRQFNPSAWRELRKVYNTDVAPHPHQYLLFDCHPGSQVPNAFRVRKDILPDDVGVQVFCTEQDLQDVLSRETTA